MPPASHSPAPSGSYWHRPDRPGRPETPGATSVLTALRSFRAADASMRRRVQGDVHVNETDLFAIRHLIRAEIDGRSVAPGDLSRLLGISSAATAKLLARLVTTGHIRREADAGDRRAQIIHPTPTAHRQVRLALEGVHRRMREVAENLPAAERVTVIRFLEAMAAAVTSPERAPLAPEPDG